MLKTAIAQLVDRQSLSHDQIVSVFESIFAGEATPAQIAGFLVALRMKGETPEEIAGAAHVMRSRSTPVRVPQGRPVIDTCGTGGDGAQTFNISTAVAFVAAAAGATVAKHGNRSVSSRSGSADVLEAAGVSLNVDVAVIERCIDEVGIGFLFAPSLHPAMKHAAGPRKELALRSIFNLLGPLSNPARARRQLIGVYDAALVPVVARTLSLLGHERAVVVHGDGGLDEISPCGSTRVAVVDGAELREQQLTPEELGVQRFRIDEIRGGDPAENAAILRRVLGGEPGPYADAVALNAAAAIWVAGLCDTFAAGAERAREVLRAGAALRKLDALVDLTRSAAGELAVARSR